MTVQWTVRAALTEERSKAEIKNSALRCRDETKSSYLFMGSKLETKRSGVISPVTHTDKKEPTLLF